MISDFLSSPQSQVDCNTYVSNISASSGFDISGYVYDDCFISLTMNSIQFAKNMLTFADDLLKLFTVELEDFITDSLAIVYNCQVNHFETSLKSGKFKKEVRATLVLGSPIYVYVCRYLLVLVAFKVLSIKYALSVYQ